MTYDSKWSLVVVLCGCVLIIGSLYTDEHILTLINMLLVMLHVEDIRLKEKDNGR